MDYDVLNSPKPSKKFDDCYELVLSEGDVRVAYAKWFRTSKFVSVIEVEVHQEYRRQGVATSIYNALLAVTKLPLKWQRNAIASDGMRSLIVEFCKSHEVICDDGQTLYVR